MGFLEFYQGFGVSSFFFSGLQHPFFSSLLQVFPSFSFTSFLQQDLPSSAPFLQHFLSFTSPLTGTGAGTGAGVGAGAGAVTGGLPSFFSSGFDWADANATPAIKIPNVRMYLFMVFV
ncbi:MAG TPA: hypothetical protein DIW47_11150 [Bacteroidetes bacterium]|nr:hypothetical protein [Bacteroidota bacterium]